MKLERRFPLWELLSGQRLRYGAAIVAMWLAILIAFAVPLVGMVALDAIAPPASGDGPAQAGGAWLARRSSELRGQHSRATILVVAAGLSILLTLVAGVFHYLRGRWAAQASETIVRNLRDRLYAHLSGLPAAYHDEADTGDLVQRCSSDVETVRVFLAAQVVEIGRSLLLLATVLPILLLLDLRMTLASLALFPFILAFAVSFFGRVKAHFLRSDEAEAAMTAVLQENLTGIRVVRAFGRQELECEKFAERNAENRDHLHRLIRLLGRYWASSDFLCVTQIGIVTLLGGAWMAEGRLTIGTYYAFLGLQALVIWPVRNMGRVLSETGKAVVSLGRIREVLAAPAETDRTRRADEVATLRGNLELRGLSFAFATGQDVLRDVSFEIAPGETVAILGPPGSGKSVLIQLLLRLYDYEHGSIRLDGRDLSTLSRAYVRDQIGVVQQEPFLYSKTIRENLLLGHGAAEEEALIAAANTASVHGSIAGFRSGYDTLVGERGVTLSGGQRQRVALARALLKDPAVLVLDDALSAVDTETEGRIFRALDERRGRRTTLIVTHRLSSIPYVDRILLLDAGSLVQAGTHAELVEVDGPYRRLWAIQDTLEERLESDLTSADRPALRSMLER